ncbi:MAG TPA: lipopolysaccharide biosynthesis protein [Candidatus Dormibacteraeota bacterium]|nr:lipopolysaccharide biosynthesis protein [Candidatus Dormibacteraeota bacterium]
MKPFDASGAFIAAAQTGQLRRRAVRGAGASVLGQAIAFGVQMVATVVLARLLAPGDVGVVTMVTTFSLLLMSFGLTGFTDAILQRDEIDHFLISNLFWINVIGGLVLAVGFASAGSLLVRFYGDPRVGGVAIAISATIFLTSTSVQHLALLKRAMRFSVVSMNDVIARCAAVAISILLAWRGWGYWALVAGAIAQPLSVSVGAWLCCRWIPGLPKRVAGTDSMVRFAMHTYGRYTLNYAARNMDNLLVGWRFGSQALGFYKKAYDLFLLSASQLVIPLNEVAVSTLSRSKADWARYRENFLAVFSVLAFIGMGIGAGVALVGRDLVLLLLGPKWDQSGRIFTFFGPGIGIMFLYTTHSWIHLSIGTPHRWFRWGIVEFIVTGLLFALLLPWGPIGLAVAWTASLWILIVPAFWYAGKPIGLGIAAVVGAVWKYVVACLLASGIVLWTSRALPSGWMQHAMERIGIISSMFAALYIAAVVLLHRGLAPVKQVLVLLQEFKSSKRLQARMPGVATDAVTDDVAASVSTPR